MNSRTLAVLALAVASLALGACEFSIPGLDPFGGQDVVLSDQPMLIGPKPVRLTPASPLEVRGLTTEFCVVLSNDIAKEEDPDAALARLTGGAKLTALLHASGGRDYSWSCDSWREDFSRSGTRRFSACARLTCSKPAPPKGTKITSVDLSSDRPVRILGANWSSTPSFDHIAQPEPDRIAIASPEYSELEHEFGGQTAWAGPAQKALQVTISKNGRLGEQAQYNSTLGLRLGSRGIQLEPQPAVPGMGVVTIPIASVAACSMNCVGPGGRETNLLLPRSAMMIDVLSAPNLTEWCWKHRIPMASAASRRAWEYDGTPLPDNNVYASQFVSHEAYISAAGRSCVGY